MSQPHSTFSESWHRVAKQRIALRPTVRVQRQNFRGERWFVLHNPFNNEFFRLRPAAYEFVTRLDGGTVEEAWTACMEKGGDEAPGQDEAIQLLAQLYQANLVRTELPADTAKLFKRQKRRQQRELRARFTNILSIRIPLFDPDDFLKSALPFVRWLMTWFGALLWIGTVGAAIKTAVDNGPALRAQADSILAPGNLVWLYAAMIGIKALHELGHAFTCRRFGGEVHTIGLLIMFFNPVPFVDATSSWAFRSRWQRILVGAAGMIVELFIAAIATFIWSSTAPGVIHSVAYNVMFIASVTTLLFNANPLLRYDGYYILSDLLEIPNLQMRATAMLTHLAERWLFGCRHDQNNPARSSREALWLFVYGIASLFYRVALFVGIALFIADKYLVLGLILGVVCLASYTVVPAWKFIAYLLKSPRLARKRPRAVAVSALGFAMLLLFLGLCPFPNSFRAPGILKSAQYSDVFAGVAGRVENVFAKSSTRVKKNQPLVQLENPELALELAVAQAEYEQVQAEQQRALHVAGAELASISERIAAFEKHIRQLKDQQSKLVIRAPQDGIWAAPLLDEAQGAWVTRGMLLGKVVDDRGFIFSAVVSQDEAANLFTKEIKTAQVRIIGQTASPLVVTSQQIIPAEQEHLPSAALGWRSGGEVAVAQNDPHGMRAAESFFELRATVAPSAENNSHVLWHGRSGKIRCVLPSEPLLTQWERKLRQLLQRRFQI